MLHTADSCSRHVRVVQRAGWPSGQWVAAGWQRRLQAQRDCRIADSRVCVDTTAVIPEIAGSHRLLRGGSADHGVHAAYLDAYFVVMLCFKFVYAVLCGILRYLSFVVSS